MFLLFEKKHTTTTKAINIKGYMVMKWVLSFLRHLKSHAFYQTVPQCNACHPLKALTVNF